MSMNGITPYGGASGPPKAILPARLEAPSLGSDAGPNDDPLAALAAPPTPDLTALAPNGSSALSYSAAQRVAMMNSVVKSNMLAALSASASGNTTPSDFATGSSPILSLYQQYGTTLLGAAGLVGQSGVAKSNAPQAPPPPKYDPFGPAPGVDEGSFERFHPPT